MMEISVCCWDKRVDTVSRSIWAALKDSGHDADFGNSRFDEGRWTIHLGAQEACKQGVVFPERTIIYNLEHLASGQSTTSTGYLDLLSRSVVWDFSRKNMEWMAGHDIATQVEYVPVGFHPILEFETTEVEEDIDVLFYGSVNARRAEILEWLAKLNCRMEIKKDIYEEKLV